MNVTGSGLDSLSPTDLSKIFFGGVFTGGMAFGLATGAITLAPKRALEHPLNMPFGFVRKGEAESPRFRWLIGNIFGLALTAAGFLGAYTDALPSGYAKDVCSYFLLPWGMMSNILHLQLTWERCNGYQIAKVKTIPICMIAQTIYLTLTTPFMISLFESGESPLVLGLFVLSSACILMTWSYRAAAIVKAGFDAEVFEKQYLCPFGFKKE